jgi:hypothetical protein
MRHGLLRAGPSTTPPSPGARPARARPIRRLAHQGSFQSNPNLNCYKALYPYLSYPTVSPTSSSFEFTPATGMCGDGALRGSSSFLPVCSWQRKLLPSVLSGTPLLYRLTRAHHALCVGTARLSSPSAVLRLEARHGTVGSRAYRARAERHKWPCIVVHLCCYIALQIYTSSVQE